MSIARSAALSRAAGCGVEVGVGVGLGVGVGVAVGVGVGEEVRLGATGGSGEDAGPSPAHPAIRSVIRLTSKQ
jgi:hypothetical protein